MALSGQKDPDLSVISIGESRGVIEIQLTKIVRERVLPDGSSEVFYEYTLGNEPSVGRALGHGVMDVLTLGLWEVAGTPIEGIAANERVHQIMIHYDARQRVTSVNRAPVTSSPAPMPETDSDSSDSSG